MEGRSATKYRTLAPPTRARVASSLIVKFAKLPVSRILDQFFVSVLLHAPEEL